MEPHAIDMRFVPWQFTHHRPVARLPEFHESIVATGSDEFAVGARGHGSHPALVSRNLANRLRFFGRNRPPNQSSVATAANQCLAVRRKSECVDPAFVTN